MGLDILSRSEKLFFFGLLIVSILVGFIDVVFARMLEPVMNNCAGRSENDVCGDGLFVSAAVFLVRAFLGLLVGCFSAFFVSCITKRLLGVNTSYIFGDAFSNNNERNGSGLHTLTNDIPHFTHLYMISMLTIFVELCLALPMIGYVIWINDVTLNALTFVIISFVVGIYFSVRVKLTRCSEVVQSYSKTVTQTVPLVSRLIRPLVAMGGVGAYLDTLSVLFKKYAAGVGFIFGYSIIQRYLIEIALIIACGVVYFFGGGFDQVSSGALIGFGVLFYRVVPSLGRLNAAVANVRFSSASVSRLGKCMSRPAFSDDWLDRYRDGTSRMVEECEGLPKCRWESSVCLSLDGNKDFKIDLSERVGVTWIKGPSGVGKTTLLESFFRPELARARRQRWPQFFESGEQRRIAYVQQLNDFKLSELEGFVLAVCGPDASLDLILQLANVRIDPSMQPNDKLSGGEAYRFAFAVALHTPSDLLLLDEPFASQDGSNVRLVGEMVLEVSKTKLVLLVSHQQPPGEVLAACTKLEFVKT